MKRVCNEATIAFTESWNVSYFRSERDSGNDQRNVQMSWQNRTPEQIVENFNAFLVATGVPLSVVPLE